MTVSDPPTQGEVQAIANKVDQLLAALLRTTASAKLRARRR